MTRALSFARIALAVRGVPPDGMAKDPLTAWQWLLATWSIRFRWAAAGLCLLIVPLAPAVSRPLAVVLAAALCLGNALLAWLLYAHPVPSRLRTERGLATTLEWTIGLGVIGLFRRAPHTQAPAILLLLVLLTGTRHGLRGLIGAKLGAAVFLLGWIGAQRFPLGVLAPEDAAEDLAGWELLIVLTALFGGALLRARGAWFRWQTERSDEQAAAIRRLECGLSTREWMLLPWLTRDELTCAEIGARLHISPETVKTHVRHLSAKLGATGRQGVVKVARERGLLSSPEPHAATALSVDLCRQNGRVKPELSRNHPWVDD